MNVFQSPFNVGLAIDLPEFTLEQVHELAQRHHLNLTQNDIQQLVDLVGGHPYLVRVAFYALANQEMPLTHLCQTAATESGVYGDHLRRHLWILERNPELADAIKQIVAMDGPVRIASTPGFKLQALGLVNLSGNEVMLRCNLYRQYFCDRFKVS
jgi:serine/threonine-protein kinase